MFYLPQFIVLVLYFLCVNIFIFYVHHIAYFDRLECWACKELDFVHKNFDYIIVGSGSAGSIVARRLAEDKNVKVLLLEAGGRGNSLFHIPAFGLMLQKTVFDWQYKTVSQTKACQAMVNKQSLWPMGKIFGGTGMLNNMIYVRAHQEDFIRWYQDDPAFNYHKDILPYFEKLENSSVIISDLPYRSKLAEAVVKSARILNFSLYNGTDVKSGFSAPKVTLQNGRRFTPAQTLHVQKHKNLVIHSNAFVQEILFKDTNEIEASGVRFSYMDDVYTVKASRAVILSAGVIGSPKILMLSGIGPDKHLKQMKIETRVNLPVGENLQDHVTTGFDLVLVNASLGVGIEDMLSPVSAYEYFVKGYGPWTSVGCENLAFFNVDKVRKYNKRPDLQLMVIPVGLTTDSGSYLKQLVGLSSDKLWNKYFSKINQSAISILPIVTHPYSRGFVRLKNKNPETPPIIDPKYLTDDRDVDVLIQGIEVIKQLISTAPMTKLGARLNKTPFPGCQKYEFDSRKYWECYIRHMTLTSYHPVGTCKMGEVVGFDFKVKGVDGLYVVDGSVLPSLTSGNPVGTIMMLAEKAVDSIKNADVEVKSSCDSQEEDYC